MLTLGEAIINPGTFVLAFMGMAFVLVFLGGIFWYSWHETKRKQGFKLQKERESTHREIAAYVAEGSISPDDAERLIRAMGETNDVAHSTRHESVRLAEGADGSKSVSVGGVVTV